MFSASAGLLCLFEISLANDQNLSELMLVLSELMPFGIGPLQCLCLFSWVLSSAFAYWHGFGLALLTPFGMDKVNIVNMTLFKL